MSFFRGKDAARQEPLAAVAPPPLRRVEFDVPEAANSDALPLQDSQLPPASLAPETAHYRTYADVPSFKGLLSAGEKPLISLMKEQRETVAIIELTGRAALIVHSNCDRAQLEAIKGKLRERNFTLKVATAEPAVVRSIYQFSEHGEGGNGARSIGNEFMAAASEWIGYAVANRATDIHIETRGSMGIVKFRVDGEIETMKAPHGGKYPATFVQKVMSTLFNNEQQTKSGNDSLFNEEKYLYCMVPYSQIPGHSLKLRYQSLKGNEGPKTVLRLLHVDEDQETLDFDALGYAPSHVDLWRQAMETPSGAVFISGVTGSGKSTSQKSFIELNPNTPHSAVFTVEDPVEYPIRGAHQIPIQRDLANPEESAKRYSEVISALMRADPDVVMLGEIRDRFSSNAAQQFAESGHMALGTVHAHLLSGIVPRLVNPEIGMSRAILTGPNMITLLAYQALVPKLCPECAESTEVASAKSEGVAQIAKRLKSLDLDTAPMRWKCSAGCERCNHRGTIGLTVVAEMLMPDDDWLRHIRDGRDSEAVEVYRSHSDGDLTSPNMTGKTVFEHTLFKALQGQVDARQCSRFDTWFRFMQRIEKLQKKDRQ